MELKLIFTALDSSVDITQVAEMVTIIKDALDVREKRVTIVKVDTETRPSLRSYPRITPAQIGLYSEAQINAARNQYLDMLFGLTEEEESNRPKWEELDDEDQAVWLSAAYNTPYRVCGRENTNYTRIARLIQGDIVEYYHVDTGQWLRQQSVTGLSNEDAHRLAGMLKDQMTGAKTPNALPEAYVLSQIDEEARKYYHAYVNNSSIHSNRLPSWNELSTEGKQEYRDKVKPNPILLELSEVFGPAQLGFPLRGYVVVRFNGRALKAEYWNLIDEVWQDTIAAPFHDYDIVALNRFYEKAKRHKD